MRRREPANDEGQPAAMPAAGRPAGLREEQRRQHRAERQDRADREVDAADEDDHGHADGDKPGDRDLPQHVGQVARGEKMFRPLEVTGEKATPTKNKAASPQ